jgi:hypothetical protein
MMLRLVEQSGRTSDLPELPAGKAIAEQPSCVAAPHFGAALASPRVASAVKTNQAGDSRSVLPANKHMEQNDGLGIALARSRHAFSRSSTGRCYNLEVVLRPVCAVVAHTGAVLQRTAAPEHFNQRCI